MKPAGESSGHDRRRKTNRGNGVSRLAGSTLTPPYLAEMARRSLDEDEAGTDVTTLAVVPDSRHGDARIQAGGSLVVSGTDMAAAVFSTHDASLQLRTLAAEGQSLQAGDTVLAVSGSCSSILSSERVALNFLQHLCGIASLARRATDLVRDTGVQLLATRKTLPGLRALERRAAEAGGFVPHRTSLGDGILIKDNHIACAGSPAAAVLAARRQAVTRFPVQVEVDHMEQLEEVIDAGADLVLLDNFSPPQVASAVAAAAGRVVLEASGGITLENLQAYAATGVQRISVGFVTHSAPAADLSLDLQMTGAGHGA